MDMHWPLYGDILPRLQGRKIRGCHFCLPSALTLPCNHSMWSVLSGFSLRSETKVPGPEAFTAVTTLQMSAIACPLSHLPPQKKMLILFKLASFPMSPFRTQYEPPQETEHVCVHVQEKQPFSQWVSPPPKRGGGGMKRRKEKPCPLLHTAEPLHAIRCWWSR